MLTKKQFDILTTLEKTGVFGTQRRAGRSHRHVVGHCQQNPFFSHRAGVGLQQRHYCKRAGNAGALPGQTAIFIAAGFGSRMVPITLNTPKPLVRVKGRRIIDTLLDAVVHAGIEEIYIVRGYLAEQFDQLLYKYPQIKFIENSAFNEANNISSLMCVRFLLQNAYVLEGDLLLSNEALITKYQYASNYLGVPVDMTDDWCFKTKNDIITKVMVGGTNCHHMIGISYWSEQDGAKLAAILPRYTTPPAARSGTGTIFRWNITQRITRSWSANAPLTTSWKSTLSASSRRWILLMIYDPAWVCFSSGPMRLCALGKGFR